MQNQDSVTKNLEENSWEDCKSKIMNFQSNPKHAQKMALKNYDSTFLTANESLIIENLALPEKQKINFHSSRNSFQSTRASSRPSSKQSSNQSSNYNSSRPSSRPSNSDLEEPDHNTYFLNTI